MTSLPPFYCISHKDPGWPLPPERGIDFHAHPSELQGLPIEAFIGDGTTPLISAPINFPCTVMQ
jgi:hypothetical protein